MPALNQTPPTPAHDVFGTAAVTGLFGIATLALCKMPVPDRLAVLDAIKDCRASFVWTVEAEGGHATIKTEVHRPDRAPEVVGVSTVSLDYSTGRDDGSVTAH